MWPTPPGIGKASAMLKQRDKALRKQRKRWKKLLKKHGPRAAMGYLVCDEITPADYASVFWWRTRSALWFWE